MKARRPGARKRRTDEIDAAAEALRSAGVGEPRIAVVLGSGLSTFADGVGDPLVVPYSEIPGMTDTGVSGHRGAVMVGDVGGKRAVVFSGRVHHYEGRPPPDVTFAVRLAALLGVRELVVTNASGGIDPGFDVGDLMLIRDHISLVSGPRRLPGGTVRMGAAYSDGLVGLAREKAAELRIPLREGVYLGQIGPTYETPAEIVLARSIGASAVGMSTVSEVQEAVRAGLEVLGVALITNVPLPGRFEVTTHKEVLEAGREGGTTLLSLVSGVAQAL